LPYVYGSVPIIQRYDKEKYKREWNGTISDEVFCHASYLYNRHEMKMIENYGRAIYAVEDVLFGCLCIAQKLLTHETINVNHFDVNKLDSIMIHIAETLNYTFL
jgi:hypothetical protein